MRPAQNVEVQIKNRLRCKLYEILRKSSIFLTSVCAQGVRWEYRENLRGYSTYSMGIIVRKRSAWKREKIAWKKNEILCGIDEVGTGAWAGPVYAGAAIFPKYVRVPKLMDSKALRPEEREAVAKFLMEHCVWAVGQAEVQEINDLGLRKATFLAMRRAISGLKRQPTVLTIDALQIPEVELPQESVIRGDAQIASISAAAIIAKFHRDMRMIELDQEFPGYGFAAHKGYGTKEHQMALKRLGCSPVHRANYRPIYTIARMQGLGI